MSPRSETDWSGTSCGQELCDLDEACPFFANCHRVWRLHAEPWELEAARARPEVRCDKS